MVFSVICVEDLGAAYSGKGSDGLCSSKFSLGMGSSEYCLPVAQEPSKWDDGSGGGGCSLGIWWAGASCMPQACPKPLGWQPHQAQEEPALALSEEES